MSTDPRSRAWLEVDGAALRRNVAVLQDAVGPGVGIVPMVKADAYGLGVLSAVKALEACEPLAYGVAAVAEGEALREAGVRRPIWLFSPVPPGEWDRALAASLVPPASDVATLSWLADEARKGRDAAFQVEVDTGMGRAGLPAREVGDWKGAVQSALGAGARLVGVFTHLHSADESAASVREQVARFNDAVAAMALPAQTRRHVLNSPGALRVPTSAFDLVRPGIFMYGGEVGDDLPPPEPVARLQARVVRVVDAQPGDTLGYGSTHVATAKERWATVAIGYGDGLPRALSNCGSALVHGRRVPIVGRISMDVTVVETSALPSVEPGAVVTLMGRDGDEIITVDEVARLAGTISYEILTGITARVPRIWEGLDGS